eukprot:TRINITY_DN103415_c0_g1_i1.p1 TRINITY_DN103415_c0_g1~~TRINITY_DN103415_c0_g1_i1.p1  ORF type:complete len:199 (+),score=34.61 TRINITY_DN103415_c0_g1_i1:93-689(+)
MAHAFAWLSASLTLLLAAVLLANVGEAKLSSKNEIDASLERYEQSGRHRRRRMMNVITDLSDFGVVDHGTPRAVTCLKKWQRVPPVTPNNVTDPEWLRMWVKIVQDIADARNDRSADAFAFLPHLRRAVTVWQSSARPHNRRLASKHAECNRVFEQHLDYACDCAAALCRTTGGWAHGDSRIAVPLWCDEGRSGRTDL